MLSLRQFCETRCPLNDLERFTSVPEDAGVSALIYAESVYIAVESPHSNKRYYLPLGNQEFESDDLAELEPILYEYYKSENS